MKNAAPKTRGGKPEENYFRQLDPFLAEVQSDIDALRAALTGISSNGQVSGTPKLEISSSLAQAVDGTSVQGRGPVKMTVIAQGSITTAALSVTTSSFQPKAGRWYIVVFASWGLTGAQSTYTFSTTQAGITYRSIAGAGASAVIASAPGGSGLQYVYGIPNDAGTAPTAGTVTQSNVTMPGIGAYSWIVIECEGDLINNGATATLPIAQVKGGTSAVGATTLAAAAWGAFLDATDSAFIAIAWRSTPGTVTLPSSANAPAWSYALVGSEVGSGTLSVYLGQNCGGTPSAASVTWGTSVAGTVISAGEIYGPPGGYVRQPSAATRFVAVQGLVVPVGQAFTTVKVRIRHPSGAAVILALWRLNLADGSRTLLGADQSTAGAVTSVSADEVVTMPLYAMETAAANYSYFLEASCASSTIDARLYHAEVI